MARQARVTSIDVVQTFAAAMKCFADDAASALDALELEIRRALAWIEHDQKSLWNGRVHRGWDEVTEARRNLERKLMFPVADERPSCHDEKKALEAAQKRLRLAQHKVEAVRHWSRVADREANEYVGAVSQLRRWLEHDLPNALADLERMSRALEGYVAAGKGPGPVAVEADAAENVAGAGRSPDEAVREQPAEPENTEPVEDPGDEILGP